MEAHFWEFARTRIMSTLSAFRKVLSVSTCDLSGLMSWSSTTQMSFFRVSCGTAFAMAVKQYTCRPGDLHKNRCYTAPTPGFSATGALIVQGC